MFKIGQLSKKTNISVPTIRFYEKKGLLSPIYVDKWTGYRFYDDSSIVRLKEVVYFKNLGFSLDEILNLDDRIIKNKIEESKNNIKNLTNNISILSSFQKGEKCMTKSEIVKEVLEKLENNHLNLYHSCSKQTIKDFIASKDWDNMNEKQFDFNMLKLFSKFADSQTKWQVRFVRLDKWFEFLQDNIYLNENKKLLKVIKIGGIEIQKIIKQFRSLLSYETNETFVYPLRNSINNAYFFELLHLIKDNCLTIEVEGGKIFEAKIIDKPTSFVGNKKFYEYSIMEKNILFVKVRKCCNDENYPFEQFVKDIEKEIKKYNIKNYILDVRNNRGYSTAVLTPFYDLVKNYILKGAILINYITYGAVCLNIAKLKEDFDVCLIGEPTGCLTMRYGQTMHLNVDNYFFSVSTKLFDISGEFGYRGAIQPDVFVPVTAKDLELQNDIQLSAAINYFK